MTINSEQIQALKAAIDDATQGGWVNESGEGWEAICCDDDQGNAGFIIAEFQGRDAAANRKFVQCANPNTILSLLAERDADKALIAESVVLFETLRQRIAELEREKDAMTAAALAMRDDMREDRTLTVKLPEYYDMLWQRNPGGSYETVEAISVMKIKAMLIDAGITLVVG